MPGRFLSWLVVAMFAPLAGLVGCGGGEFWCVAEGTLVSTPSGEVPVEHLRPGDRVLTRAESGQPGTGRVVATRGARVYRTLVLELSDGRTLRVTEAHPIATPTGWARAGSLAPGARVEARAVGGVEVLAIRDERGRTRVFDLAVEPDHTFFANGVLTHNKSYPMIPDSAEFIGDYFEAEEPDESSLAATFDAGGGWIAQYSTYSFERGHPPALLLRVDSWELDRSDLTGVATTIRSVFPERVGEVVRFHGSVYGARSSIRIRELMIPDRGGPRTYDPLVRREAEEQRVRNLGAVLDGLKHAPAAPAIPAQ